MTLDLVNGFLDITPKTKATKRKYKQNIIKIKFLHVKDIMEKVKDNEKNGRQISQVIYMIRDLYQGYIRNSYNLIKNNPI